MIPYVGTVAQCRLLFSLIINRRGGSSFVWFCTPRERFFLQNVFLHNVPLKSGSPYNVLQNFSTC